MARAINNAGFLTFAIFLLSLISLTHGENFNVQGKIYCDTCRIQFETRVSTFIEGATVKLECKDREGGNVTFSKEATTDKSGSYDIMVDGDHEEEICEIIPIKSPLADCNEISKEKFERNAARVSLTSHNGIASDKRQANPIGFLRKERLVECAEVLREMGIPTSRLV